MPAGVTPTQRPAWPGRPVLAAALLAAGAAAVLSLAAPAAVRWLDGHGMASLFEGTRPASYYGHWLRVTAAVWALLLPLFLLVGDGLRLWSRAPGRVGGRTARLLLGLALLTVVVAAWVPRYRTGDEPAYLAMAASLWRDGDLDVTESPELVHPSPAALHGQIRSVHGAAMAWLLAVPQGLMGGLGVALLTAALGVATILVLRRLIPLAVRGPTGSVLTALAAVSFPILPYSGLAFPDMASALCIGVVYSRLVSRRGRGLAVAAAIALLPWLNPRMVPPAVVLAATGIMAERREPRRSLLTLALPLVASLGVMALFHLKWFGWRLRSP